ncbi:MAG: hypothetical protein KGL58_03700, partial [Pseudomonadota bacterium]|nr:hypothetical protein [Pseudomonadota bacterium]
GLLWLWMGLCPVLAKAAEGYNGYSPGFARVVGGYAIILVRPGFVSTRYCGHSCERGIDYPSLYDITPFGDVSFAGLPLGQGSYQVNGPDDLDESGQPDTLVQCGSVDEAMMPVEGYVRQDSTQPVDAVYTGTAWVRAGHEYVCVKADTYSSFLP